MRAYQKPQITKVALKPEEAVLTVCKIPGGGGGKGGICNNAGNDRCVEKFGS